MPKVILGETMYTIPEVAAMLGVTSRTISTYIQKKKLKGQIIAKRWYFAEENVKDFLRGKKAQE